MKKKIIIYGRVHNTGYRLFLLEHADYLLIKNFDARNIKVNGKEALVVLLEDEESKIKSFIEFAKENKPEKAKVEKIEVHDYDGFVRDIESFRSSLNTSKLGKIVNFGLGMFERQDKTIEKLDNISEKLDSGFAEVSQKLDLTNELLKERFTNPEKGS